MFIEQEAVNKFGISSSEARLAWEVVDDLESGYSAITAELPSGLDEECDIELDEAKCRDFEFKMQKLEALASSAKAINYQMKFEVLKLQNLKASSPSGVKVSAVNSVAYKKAKAEAEEVSAKLGTKSKEAAVAWEAVFEVGLFLVLRFSFLFSLLVDPLQVVSAADDDNMRMASLEDECLTSSSDKCVEYIANMRELSSAISGKR